MRSSVEPLETLRRSRVALLTTYRRSGEPVATPVSVAVRAGRASFVTPATSGKARRLAARADVVLAPSTMGGRATGPAITGRAHLLSRDDRQGAARLLPLALLWSYLLYRLRGHRMHVYEVRIADPITARPDVVERTTSTAQVHRAVQLTARASALLFAAAQATSALGPRTGRVPRRLYAAFVLAHAVHFTAVARYAVVNGGRDLFPGGRSLHEVGGWATVVGIFTSFSGLAATGWATGAPRVSGGPVGRPIGQAATWLMAAMFAAVYLGQLPRSRWSAVPAIAVAGAVAANAVARRLRRLSQGG